jgi:seryl-tRNA synthetase
MDFSLINYITKLKRKGNGMSIEWIVGILISAASVMVSILMYYVKQNSDRTYDAIKGLSEGLKVTAKKTTEIEVNYLHRFEHLSNVIHETEKRILEQLGEKIDWIRETLVAEQSEIKSDVNKLSNQLSSLQTEHNFIHSHILHKKENL